MLKIPACGNVMNHARMVHKSYEGMDTEQKAVCEEYANFCHDSIMTKDHGAIGLHFAVSWCQRLYYLVLGKACYEM